MTSSSQTTECDRKLDASVIKPYLKYYQIRDLWDEVDGPELVTYFLDNYALLCDSSKLYVVLITNPFENPMHEDCLEIFRRNYLHDYGLDCFDKYSAVIGGFMIITDGPKHNVKYVDLIDTTIRGLDLARGLLRHDTYTEFIPRGVLEESSLFWFRYLRETYRTSEELDKRLNNLQIRRDLLGWQYLDMCYQQFEETNIHEK